MLEGKERCISIRVIVPGLVRATKGGSRTKLLGLFFEKRNIFIGVQSIASVRDKTL